MKKKVFSKSLAWILSVVMVLGVLVLQTTVSVSAVNSSTSGFSKNYTITGDGFTDMVNIAMAQNEKTQSQIGYNGSWCAAFVSDCAVLAGQDSAIPWNGAVPSMYNAVLNAGGCVISSPQAGDLVFFSSGSGYGHVGIVLDGTQNISGNIFYNNQSPSRVKILYNKNEGYSSWTFVRPNYKNTPVSYNPEGHLDGADSPEAGKLHVAGWAFDRDDVNASLGIHIYVGGTFAGEISAWKGRADVNGSFPGVGDYHGFEETIDVSQSGTQTVDVYAINVGGGSNVHIGSATVNIAEKISDIYVPVMQEAYVDNVTPYGFRLNAKVSDNVGVSRVEFETWKDGSPLRKTYVAQSIGNDMYIYDVNIADLTDEAGVYHSIVHAYDPSNNHSTAEIYIIVPDKDTVAPTITDIYPYNFTEDGYTLHFVVHDDTALSYVRVYTQGSVPQTSEDIAVGGTGWEINYRVNYSDHDNVKKGYTHAIWVFDTAGNRGDSDWIYVPYDDENPVISDVTVSQVTSKGYRVTCRVSDNVGVTSVSFPTWTPWNDGQDDLIWHEGTISGNIATCYINTSDHNNEIGYYVTHIYAYDLAGNSHSISTGDIYVSDEPIEFSSVSYGEHQYIVYNSGMNWTRAKQWCESNGGYLATVTSEAEWNQVLELLKKYNGVRCWLGAESTSGAWKWTTGEAFDYAKWDEGQPDCAGSVEYYLGTYGGEFHDSYMWNDYTKEGWLIGGFVFEKVEHQYKEEVIAPTCTEKGYTLHTCIYCGDSYKDTYTAALGHDYEETVIAPTVDEQGYTLHTCSKCGHSYKDNYTNKLLVNTTILAAEDVKLGSYITINASAAGGTGDYTYAVWYKQSSASSWTTKQNYSTNATIKIKPASAEKYDISVKVKDSSGTIVKKAFTVNVFAPLKNTTTVSSTSIGYGGTFTVKAKATGGLGDYTYAVYYKKASATKWTTAQNYSSTKTVTIKPKYAEEYDVSVKVKDSRGVVAKKTFKIKVTKPTNTSKVASTTITLGNTIDITCSATGGSGFYQYAVYYKKSSDTSWKTKQSYSSNTNVSIKPASKTKYDVSVKVKDSLGNVSKQTFTITVK